MKKIALITGGSKGIGASTCRALARDGFYILIHYNKSIKEAESLAKQISGEAFHADLESDEDIHSLKKLVSEKYGKIDVLINNAGTADCESLQQLTKESFFKTLQINLWSHTLLTSLLFPIINKNGAIIFTSSVCANVPTPDVLAYAASKAGIEAIVRSIAKELAPDIRVNAVAPTATYTNMMIKNYSQKDIEWFENASPMGRFCDPEDISEAIAFLVSEKAKNITEQVLTIDTGMSVR